MFRTDLLSIIRSLNTVYTSIGICHASYVDCLLARSGCWLYYKNHYVTLSYVSLNAEINKHELLQSTDIQETNNCSAQELSNFV